MNGGDIASIVIISLMALRVSFKGFVSELSSKSGMIFGLFTSVIFAPMFSVFLDSRFNLGRYAQIASLLSLFVAGYVLARYLLSSLEDVFAILHLRAFDHILGFGLGALEGVFFVVTAVYLLGMQNTVDLSSLYTGSQLLPILYPVFPQVLSVVTGSLMQVIK
jgi:membrane protein required for colicin V production